MKIRDLCSIGGILPRKGLVAVTGGIGVGKSHTLCKFLNTNSVSPIWFLGKNMYASPEMNYKIILRMQHVQELLALNYTDIKAGTVIVIDDYQALTEELQLTTKEAIDRFKAVVDYYNVLLIAITYSIEFSNLMESPIEVSTLLDETPIVIDMQKTLPISRKQSKITYTTTITGVFDKPIVFDNWMREPVINPLTNKVC